MLSSNGLLVNLASYKEGKIFSSYDKVGIFIAKNFCIMIKYLRGE